MRKKLTLGQRVAVSGPAWRYTNTFERISADTWLQRERGNVRQIGKKIYVTMDRGFTVAVDERQCIRLRQPLCAGCKRTIHP